MNDRKHYALLLLIVATALAFSLLGSRWNGLYYNNKDTYTLPNFPLVTAMKAIHDGTYLSDLYGSRAFAAVF